MSKIHHRLCVSDKYKVNLNQRNYVYFPLNRTKPGIYIISEKSCMLKRSLVQGTKFCSENRFKIVHVVDLVPFLIQEITRKNLLQILPIGLQSCHFIVWAPNTTIKNHELLKSNWWKQIFIEMDFNSFCIFFFF